MNEAVIQARGVGKRYRLGDQMGVHQTLPEAINEKIRRAVNLVRRTRRETAAVAGRGEFWALRNVSFDVNRGEVVGVIGRNGAGKSTLLKILSQITDPTEGHAVVHGRVASLLEVGTGFHPELTGRENIYLNGSILGMTRREINRKFDQIVDFSGVERFLDTPIKRYSSGMTMRLAFSVAAHLDPEILIIDEVLAVGDAAFQKKCLGKMDEVARQGRTVIFVSHNMSAVNRLCSRGILLTDGAVQAVGDVQTVINRYYQDINRGSSSCRVDLTRQPSDERDPAVEVLSIELANPMAETFAICWDQPIELKMRLRVNEPIRNATFGIGCRTLDQVPVFTVYSGHGQADQACLAQPGEREVRVSIDHNLNEGLYGLLVGISSGQRVYYYNQSVAQLEILGVGQREHHGNRWGLIHCDSRWRF